MWIFDINPRVDHRQPRRHTFGFTLRGGKGVASGAGKVLAHAPWPISFGADIFRTAQSAWDTRFVSQSTRTRTVVVDALNVGTTQFSLDEATKQQLLASGRSAATEFLDEFQPDGARNTYGAAPT